MVCLDRGNLHIVRLQHLAVSHSYVLRNADKHRGDGHHVDLAQLESRRADDSACALTERQTVNVIKQVQRACHCTFENLRHVNFHRRLQSE